MKKLAVIIPAAGSGTRLGSRLAKPFIPLEGKAILEYTLEKFLAVEPVSQIIVATAKDSMEKVSEMFLRLHRKDVAFRVVEGGSERQYSIQNALEVLDHDVELVAVHDAVRPFIEPGIIERCAAACKHCEGAVVGVPAKDTIKKVDEDLKIQQTPDRSRLWQAQTPQIFRKEILIRAYRQAAEDDFTGTDDASLVERIGGRIKMVKGGRENLKITYPIDLKVAELIVREGYE